MTTSTFITFSSLNLKFIVHHCHHHHTVHFHRNFDESKSMTFSNRSNQNCEKKNCLNAFSWYECCTCCAWYVCRVFSNVVILTIKNIHRRFFFIIYVKCIMEIINIEGSLAAAAIINYKPVYVIHYVRSSFFFYYFF